MTSRRGSAPSNLPDSQREASLLREAVGSHAPPVTPLPEIAALRRAAVVEVPDLHAHGLTHAAGDELVIKVNSRLPLVRRRFTIAHEIGHTFFYQLATAASGEPTYRRQGASGRGDQREEGWCSNFAGDLLVPSAWVEQELQGIDDPSVDLLENLASRFVVALEPVVHQLARYRLWPTLVLFASAKRSGPVVRRVFTCGLGRTALRPGMSLPHESAPARAVDRTSGSCSGPEPWLGYEGPNASDYLVESRIVADEVITLIHPRPSISTRLRLEGIGLHTQQQLFYV